MRDVSSIGFSLLSLLDSNVGSFEPNGWTKKKIKTNQKKKWIECKKHYQRENDVVVVEKNELFIIRINNNSILQLIIILQYY